MAGLVVALCAAIVSVVYIATPYNPIEFRSLRVAEGPHCPHEPVDIEVDYTIDEELYEEISEIRIDGDWVVADVPGSDPGQRLPAGELELTKEDVSPGDNIRNSRAIRSAPGRPGIWYLFSTYNTRDTRPIIPAIQTIEISSDNYIEVLPEDHPMCIEKRRGF